MKEPKPMQEVHEWRHKIYEENKNLSWKEQVKKADGIANEVIRKYGLKLRRISKAA